MSHIRIYLENFTVSETILLDSQTSHRLKTVRRLKENDTLSVFNITGEFIAYISKIKKNDVWIVIGEQIKSTSNVKLPKFHLGQSISKSDRMDYAIQKSTELGVTEITPLISKYTAVKYNEKIAYNKIRHWRTLAINSIEQSNHLAPPKINNIDNFSSWISESKAELKIILHPCDKLKSEYSPHNFGHDYNLKKYLDTISLSFTKEIAIAIGPEGGFSDEEIEYAKQENFKSISLGVNIFRTETAPIVIISILKFYFSHF